MYFNISRERVGNLFVKPFRSKHISDQEYLKRVAQYIHFNPIELFEPEWKAGTIRNETLLEQKLRKYPYSSLPEYQGQIRTENAILSAHASSLIEDSSDPLGESLTDMAAYYRALR